MTLKRKSKHQGSPAAKRARLEDFEGTAGLLGYAVGPRGGAAQCIGATEAAKEAGGRRVFESGKRKHSQIDSCSDTERFWGPREGHVEKRAMKPSEKLLSWRRSLQDDRRKEGRGMRSLWMKSRSYTAEPSGREDDDILILDVDEELLEEMDLMLKDLIL